MNAKSIIITVLSAVGAMVMAGCSTEWEEISYSEEMPSYSNDELPVEMEVHKDRADVILQKDLTCYINLDGVQIKQTSKNKKITLRALTPDTEYHLSINAMDGEKVLTKDMTFKTLKSYATVIGWREMDLYGNNEEVNLLVRQMPGGDFLDITCKDLDHSTSNLCLRRTDADSKVKWRCQIGVENASVSEEGNIVAWFYDVAYKVNPETGDVLYTFTSKTDDYLIKGAYACKDGGMAVVGKNYTAGKYYFARLDANGQLIHEEEGDFADELYDVHEVADGSVVAMGRKGEKTIVAITFDAEGKVVSTSSDYSEDRDLEYFFHIGQSIRDNKGNIYFLGHGNIYIQEYYNYYKSAIVVKVDAKGKIEWIRTQHDEVGVFSTYIRFIGDEKLCVIYSGKRTYLSFITTDNDLLQDVAFNANYNAVYAWPVNDEYTQFNLFDKYGRIIHIDTEGE